MNIELATKTLEAAKRYPDHFHMESWCPGWEGYVKETETVEPPCGTTACFAGWASFLSAPVGTRVLGVDVILPGGVAMEVEDYAREALEISPDQASTLFYLDTIEEVEAAVSYLAEHPDAEGGELWREAKPDDFL